MNVKKTFGLAGLLLGSVFAVGALAAASSAPEATEAEPAAMRSDAGPGPAPKTVPKAPGQPPTTPSLRSDAGLPGAKPMQ
jgi:hypothetical protein